MTLARRRRASDAPRFDRAPAWRAPITVDAWRWADGTTDLLVKQVLVGPYTHRPAGRAGRSVRARVLALGLAEAMNAELRALAEAGCPIIQVDEGALTAIGDDEAEWRLYAETQRRLTDGLDGAPPEPRPLPRRQSTRPATRTILDGPYRSYLVDALGGPGCLAIRVRRAARERA